MPTFVVTKADGERVKIEATSFHQTATVVRFYRDDGRLIAAINRCRSCVAESEPEPVR
ncbi:hypothetical protein [Mesorhizobium sp.]|uniref:hypothetical protein n=1 Tax=Mesorhizobium sp. TaxID=1871066 RepID=UPI0025E99AD8|nr:hypothetical protein [Mesorhizobium sp.]